jgi:transposase-like protein
MAQASKKVNMVYSVDFRKRVTAFMDEGYTSAELKEAFNIFPSTLNAWRKLFNETGQLKSRAIPVYPEFSCPSD